MARGRWPFPSGGCGLCSVVDQPAATSATQWELGFVQSLAAHGSASPRTAAAAEGCVRPRRVVPSAGSAVMALGIVLAVHSMLRTGELLSLGFGQLSWANDCRSAIVSFEVRMHGAR